jgi:hypothetical protein
MMMPVRMLETSEASRPASWIPRSPFAEEAHRAPVDDVGRIQRRRALDLGAESELGIFVGAGDSGLRLVEARKHFLGVVSDG